MRNKVKINSEITVIIPCYNSGFSILRTLSSLKSQTYNNFEIIIVNDGSTDKTVEVAKVFK